MSQVVGVAERYAAEVKTLEPRGIQSTIAVRFYSFRLFRRR